MFEKSSLTVFVSSIQQDGTDDDRLERSTDLRNLTDAEVDNSVIVPIFIKLRDLLLSSGFFLCVSEIACASPLSTRGSIMAINVYESGDISLVHDDCNPRIKNRRVSFIFYWTDLDELCSYVYVVFDKAPWC
jgi:hypothetical protein